VKESEVNLGTVQMKNEVHRKGTLHLPSIVSTQSCRPRFCCGFITQWLLVAVMSNTSQPPSDAWTFLESSKNVSASLKVREKRKTKSVLNTLRNLNQLD